MMIETIEELEKQKLAKEMQKIDAELTILKKPWYLKPTVLVSVFSLVFAVSQFMRSEIKTYQADKKIKRAEHNEIKNKEEENKLSTKKDNIERAEQDIALAELKLMSDHEKSDVKSEQMKTSEEKLDSTGEAAEDGDVISSSIITPVVAAPIPKIIDVWAFNVSDSDVQKVRSYFKNEGNKVGYGGLLKGSRPPSWLSRKSAVMYYDKNSKKEALKMAGELYKLTNTSFEVKVGGGYGVNKGDEARTFFIHLIGTE